MPRLCCTRYERLARQRGWQRIAGLDEVGRGSLFGPVVAAAVILNPRRRIVGLDDSKKLNTVQRQAAFAALAAAHVANQIEIGVGAASVTEIGRINILRAALLAMSRAVARLPAPPDFALVDGNQPPTLPCTVHCVVGGDGRSLSIAAASIVAKVLRDRAMARLALRCVVDGDALCLSVAAASIVAKVLRDRAMTRLAARWPGYGWEHNAGYGTATHRAALLRLGPTRHHREHFGTVRQMALGLED